MPMGWVAAATAAVGLLSADTARSAGNKQADAANTASANSLAMFQQNKSDLTPWVNSGVLANSALMKMLGIEVTPGAPGAGPRAHDEWIGDNYKESGTGLGLRTHDEWIADNYKGGVGWNDGLRALTPDQGYADYVSKNAAGIGPLGALSPDQGYADYLKHFNPTTNPSAVSINPNAPLLQGFTPENFLANKDPSYEFIRGQNLDAIKNAASVGGGVAGTGDSPMSGNVLRSITDYSTNMASTEYGNAFNRWNTMLNNMFSRLSSVSGTGANTAGMTAGLGANATGQAGAFGTDAAAAQAAGRVGSMNALTGAGSNIANNYMMWQMMQQQQQPQQTSQPGSFDMTSMNLA